jgi:hypothetical protein
MENLGSALSPGVAVGPSSETQLPRDPEKWRKNRRLGRMHAALVKQEHREAGLEEEPTAGILDSQSVKTPETGSLPPTRSPSES